MNYLILLDRKYPFKTGEAFLENEIEEISQAFDQVIIYPIDVCSSDKQTRTIKPSNVAIRITENEKLKQRRMKYVLKSLPQIARSSEKVLVRKIIDGVFVSGSTQQARKIIADLEKMDIKQEDTVFIYSYWLYTTAYIAGIIKDALQAKGVNTKVFSRAHRFDIYEEKRKFSFLPQQEKLMESMERIFPCSEDGSGYLIQKYPQFSKKIETAYLGTHDHGIGKSGSRETLKIVSCSRLSSVKRVDLIIKSLATMKDSGIKIAWTHIGGGELYNQLRKEAEELDWMAVDFIGPLPNSKVYDHYLNNEVDLFINVSSSEGLPVSIMEAISFGIPVIATNVGGTGEIVKSNVSGEVIEPDSVIRDLPRMIKKIYEMNTDEYSGLRRKTREFWEVRFKAEQNYKDFVSKIFSI